MNVLMQLRKVCNHPDLFDTRDYTTPSKQLFEIAYFVPYIVTSVNHYNPMKTINLKNLNLILEDFEKVTKYDYLLMLKNFPQRAFYEIYSQAIKSK
jgi:hypothetical protein